VSPRGSFAPVLALAALVAASALAGCTTDVSTHGGWGTQGWVMTWLTSSDDVHVMAAGPSGLFFAGPQGILSCPRPGCADPPELAYPVGVAPGTGAGAIARLVADDTRLYWTEIVQGSTPGGRVLTCEQSDCLGSVRVIYADLGVILNPGGADDFGFLAVDGGEVFWTASVVTSSGGLASLVYAISADTPPGSNTPAESSKIPPTFAPLFVSGGTLYGTLDTSLGTALASCPLRPFLNGCSTQIVLVDETKYQVLWANEFGGTVYFEAVVPATGARGVYACSPTCDAPVLVYPSTWSFFAVDADRPYTGMILPDGRGAFATCSAGSTCAAGLTPLDLPFEQMAFPATPGFPGVPDVVLDPRGGAYGYGLYLPPQDNVGLGTPLFAIVHLSTP
jgi:hypothetical protein